MTVKILVFKAQDFNRYKFYLSTVTLQTQMLKLNLIIIGTVAAFLGTTKATHGSSFLQVAAQGSSFAEY
jgi:hypothetical protein